MEKLAWKNGSQIPQKQSSDLGPACWDMFQGYLGLDGRRTGIFSDPLLASERVGRGNAGAIRQSVSCNSMVYQPVSSKLQWLGTADHSVVPELDKHIILHENCVETMHWLAHFLTLSHHIVLYMYHTCTITIVFMPSVPYIPISYHVIPYSTMLYHVVPILPHYGPQHQYHIPTSEHINPYHNHIPITLALSFWLIGLHLMPEKQSPSCCVCFVFFLIGGKVSIPKNGRFMTLAFHVVIILYRIDFPTKTCIYRCFPHIFPIISPSKTEKKKQKGP